MQHFIGTTRPEIIGSLIVIAVGVVLLYKLVLTHLIRFMLDYSDFRKQKGRQLVHLEITPPAVNTKTLLATSEFYAHIHGILSRTPNFGHFCLQAHSC